MRDSAPLLTERGGAADEDYADADDSEDYEIVKGPQADLAVQK